VYRRRCEKPPLAEAQTSLGNKEIRSVERGYICPIAKILLKNCFFTQNFTEIGQSAAELGPKTILNMAAVRHLEF